MLVSLFLFAAGVSIGSFLNVVGLRVPQKQSLVSPGSACPSCQYELKALDLIPVISYLCLGGKCRNCRQPISFKYPLMEFLTGAAFVYSFWNTESLLAFLFVALLLSVLISLTVSDLAYRLVPDKILFPSFLVLAPFGVMQSGNPLWNHLLGGFLFFGGALLIALLTKGGMGGGDIKLLGVLGLTLGLREITLVFMLACFTGAAVGLFLRLVRGERSIPFVPFIGIGVWLVLHHEDVLWNFIANG